MKRKTLRRKLLGWLGLYLVLVTCVVFAAANYVHERAEHAVWRALLNSELDSILAQERKHAGYHWQDSETLRFYRQSDAGGLPAELRDLAPGLHDGSYMEGLKGAVMVRQTPEHGRVALLLDITDFAALEGFITRWAMWAGIAMAIVTLLMAWLGVARLVRPLSVLAEDIAALNPEARGQRLAVDRRGSAELDVIAGALNDYLQRNEAFVERERVFVRMASHELRTPVAVINGAAELGLEQQGLPGRARQQLQRVRSAATGMEQLIQMLLVLARDPARLASQAESLAIDQLLPRIVADHQYLAMGKELEIAVGMLPACEIVAPVGVVEVTFGNLLRNAIENSDLGRIQITLAAEGIATIDDPGHGMSPEEIARRYAQMARGERSEQSGLGLELISRLCEHLGWHLDISPHPEGGTRVRLDMSASHRKWAFSEIQPQD